MENLSQKNFFKWLGHKPQKLGKIEQPFIWKCTPKEKYQFLINGLKEIGNIYNI